MSGTPYNISNPNRGFYEVAITKKPDNGLTLEPFQNKANTYPRSTISTTTNTESQPIVNVGTTQNCPQNIVPKFNTEDTNCPNILM